MNSQLEWPQGQLQYALASLVAGGGQMVRLMVTLLPVLLICGTAGRLNADDAPLPTEFYVVSMVTSDASPFWYRYILHVRPEGHGSLVRYVRVAPMDSMCSEAITIKASDVRLPGVFPSDLISSTNPCAIDSTSLNRKLQRKVHTAAIDDSVQFGIVATCGSKEVVLHLPYPEQVNLERLRKKSPELARWWDIQHSIKERAFGPGQVFYDVSEEQAERLQRNGEMVLPELLSGRFDAGMQTPCPEKKPCTRPSFRDFVRGYVGPVGQAGHSPRLLQAGEYRFSRYVPPRYPPLAMQARISGTVKLELELSPNLRHETRLIKIPEGEFESCPQREGSLRANSSYQP
jgi:hypothetical protein